MADGRLSRRDLLGAMVLGGAAALAAVSRARADTPEWRDLVAAVDRSAESRQPGRICVMLRRLVRPPVHLGTSFPIRRRL